MARRAAARRTKAPRPVETIDDLTPDPQNRRHHDDRNLGMIADGLKAVGPARSIVIDEQGVIHAGNGVIAAARKVGLKKVRVIDADGTEIIAVRRSGLTAEQKRDLALYDNRSGELSTWNIPQFQADLKHGLDLAKFFNGDELKALLETPTTKAGKTDPDDVPAPRRTSIKRGDLFELGRHRLLCGDCTKADDVERLMRSDRAGLMNTDPPYGVSYANDQRPNPGVAKPRVAKDELRDAALQTFLESAFRVATAHALEKTAAWYLWHAHLTQGFFAAAAAAAAANVVLHRQIIWVKPVLLLGRGQYHWKHEPCFMGWVEGHRPPDYGLGKGERTQTTVWEVGSVSHADRKVFNHSTPKPVALFVTPIVKHLKPGDVAYEPFAGTGPQFIAAEEQGVRCYGLEIEPSYCQVIIDRWEAFTGLKAKKVAGRRAA